MVKSEELNRLIERYAYLVRNLEKGVLWGSNCFGTTAYLMGLGNFTNETKPHYVDSFEMNSLIKTHLEPTDRIDLGIVVGLYSGIDFLWHTAVVVDGNQTLFHQPATRAPFETIHLIDLAKEYPNASHSEFYRLKEK